MNLSRLTGLLAFIRNAILLTSLLIMTLPSLSLAATISASFVGGVLSVDWGAPPVANGSWRISIVHIKGFLNFANLRTCGPGVTGWGPCGGEIDANGHFERDYTSTFLAGSLLGGFRLRVRVEAMDENGAPSDPSDISTFDQVLLTPPLSMTISGGDGHRKRRNKHIT